VIGDGDLELIFESGDFDTTATFTISTGVTVAVQGWFTGATEATNLLTQEIETVLPTFDCESSQLELASHVVKKGMNVSINSTTYNVERIQKLGTGVSTVHLRS
jgi:hypothetical protein